jgi:predicted lysophospholipase L1 biosynthesis ABC-type transport system permease subunit
MSFQHHDQPVDVESTGLVQPASRLTYRMAVAGEDPQEELCDLG